MKIPEIRTTIEIESVIIGQIVVKTFWCVGQKYGESVTGKAFTRAQHLINYAYLGDEIGYQETDNCAADAVLKVHTDFYERFRSENATTQTAD